MTNHINAGFFPIQSPMRTPLELWLIVEGYFNDWLKNHSLIYRGFARGLCYIIKEIKILKLLGFNEREYLLNEIRIYGESVGVFGHKFIWEAGAVEPRAEFIQEEILKAIRCTED